MSEYKIKITKEELDNIVTCFANDRQRITQEFGYDEDAEMYLQLLKSFKEQILENQYKAGRLDKVKREITDKKKFHKLCETKYGLDSGLGQHHHAIWEELDQIENQYS